MTFLQLAHYLSKYHISISSAGWAGAAAQCPAELLTRAMAATGKRNGLSCLAFTSDPGTTSTLPTDFHARDELKAADEQKAARAPRATALLRFVSG